jgi:hypothetical protein
MLPADSLVTDIHEAPPDLITGWISMVTLVHNYPQAQKGEKHRLLKLGSSFPALTAPSAAHTLPYHDD